MRRTVLNLMWVVGGALCGTGCVAVSATETNFGFSREVVAVDGHVYVVDKKHGKVREVDLSSAKPFPSAKSTESGGE